MGRLQATAWALVAVFALTLVGQLTVGKENNFGFACLIVWVF